MITILAIFIIALLYLWPAILSEIYLFKTGNQKTIKLRIKFYIISYGSWFLIGYSILYLTHYLQSITFEHIQNCALNVSECSNLTTEITKFIFAWGRYFSHILAFIFAWFILHNQSKRT